ncbi:hypothetical protein [Salinibaculum rarum]|uniref:hypothetical protein n=1 Tax=Salinibaculum rarum TaxID=3058903 RepID=UPI00265F8A4D|nr:hypothetical protein [Salinibaculum sp. KK48]
MSDQTFTGTYRVIGFGGNGERILLYDIDREDAVWVANIGHQDANYPAPLHDALSVVSPGNVAEATVRGDPETGDIWMFEDFDIMRDTTLAFVDGLSKNRIPGPVEKSWENRDPEHQVGVNVLKNDETGEPIFELQTHPEEFQGRNIFEDMRTGRFPLEAWYEELTSTPVGAHDIIVVNPNEVEYIVILFFPPGNEETLDDVRKDLAD